MELCDNCLKELQTKFECEKCGRVVCVSCKTTINDIVVCSGCVEDMENQGIEA